MTIKTKVIGSFVVIMLLFVGISAFNYLRFSQSNKRLALVNELFLPLSRLLVQLQGNLHGLADDMRRFYFPKDFTSENSAFARMARDLYPYWIQKKFASAERLLRTQSGTELADFSETMVVQLKSVRELFSRISISTDRDQFETLYLELRSQLQTITRRLDDECQKVTLAAQNEGRDNLIASLFLLTFVTLVGIISVLLSHRVLAPLGPLIASIKKIADGDFNQSLKVDGSNTDEIGLLAREYNRMLAALVVRDEKIQAQQREILQSERLAAVGQLSAEVVHEIRNPLNSISLNIDWLSTELSTPNQEVMKTLRSISKEVLRLHQITESYLVRSRIPSQGTVRIDVHSLLSEILEFSREEASGQNIAIETNLSPDGVFIRTDKAKLKQVFLNIYRNAREAMPRGGKLTVSTAVCNNVSKIMFTDTGYGMNEATQRNVFQPFFTTKVNGTGLGMNLTKTFVEQANGSVSCDSRMGEGTTVTLQFPV